MTELLKACNERDGYKTEAEKLECELKTIKLKYEELAKTKDREAKRKIDLRHSSEGEQFKILKKNVMEAMKPIPHPVKEALYYHFRGEDWLPPEGEWDRSVDDCVERGLLKGADPGLRVNVEHPKIRPVITALNGLERFVEKASEDFYSSYEEDYKDELSFKSRGFWDEHV
jgi:hypothetical protein